MEWVSCKDRLPEKSDNYLVIRFKEDQGSSVYYEAEHKGWNLGLDGNRENEMEIFYWMPLPQPPTEAAND